MNFSDTISFLMWGWVAFLLIRHHLTDERINGMSRQIEKLRLMRLGIDPSHVDDEVSSYVLSRSNDSQPIYVAQGNITKTYVRGQLVKLDEKSEALKATEAYWERRRRAEPQRNPLVEAMDQYNARMLAVTQRDRIQERRQGQQEQLSETNHHLTNLIWEKDKEIIQLKHELSAQREINRRVNPASPTKAVFPQPRTRMVQTVNDAGEVSYRAERNPSYVATVNPEGGHGQIGVRGGWFDSPQAKNPDLRIPTEEDRVAAGKRVLLDWWARDKYSSASYKSALHVLDHDDAGRGPMLSVLAEDPRFETYLKEEIAI